MVCETLREFDKYKLVALQTDSQSSFSAKNRVDHAKFEDPFHYKIKNGSYS